MPSSNVNPPVKEPAMAAALLRFGRSTGVVERADNADRSAKAEALGGSSTGLLSLTATLLWLVRAGWSLWSSADLKVRDQLVHKEPQGPGTYTRRWTILLLVTGKILSIV
jgi:hypothetical protein